MPRVLIVEDSPTQAAELAFILEEQGFAVTTAADAEQGRERLGREQCDLVLTDLRLPGASGFDLCRSLKADPVLCRIPVVVLTAEDDPANVLRGLEAGADGFMTKGREPEEIVGRVRRVLRRGAWPIAAASAERVRIAFLGQDFELTAGTEQILETLVSAFEDVVHLSRRLGDSQKDLREANAQTRATLLSVMDTVPVAIVIVDGSGTPTLVNRTAGAMLGARELPPLERWVEEYELRDGTGAPFQADEFPTLMTLRSGASTSGVELSIARDGGETLPVLVSTQAVRDASGSVAEVISAFTSIDERKQAEQRLLYSAFHDSLTDLPNRALFLDRLGRAVSLGRRRHDHLYAVLFLDLDRFKVINDSLGHAIGDRLLVCVAERLKTCIRDCDTVARLGGDEFTILLEGMESAEDATLVAKRVKDAFEEPFLLGGSEVFISASTGVAVKEAGRDRVEDLLRDADAAMYRAKELGGAQYVVFEHPMQMHSADRLKLETDLRHALERKQLRIHYQPIVSLASGEVVGFEALVRWQHPTRGMVAPGDFVPLAEETGLIVPIDRWVLSEACRRVKAWNDRIARSGSLTLSANLSARQFSTGDLVQKVERILTESEIVPENVKLEITESLVMEQSAAITRVARDLKKLKVDLCIDDFGTGYSSLSALHRFPFDNLKVDRAFVGGMESDGESEEIVRTVVSLAHNLGLAVIAEGVETAYQLRKLQALGCEYAQGFLFSKPLDAAAAEALISGDLPWREVFEAEGGAAAEVA